MILGTVVCTTVILFCVGMVGLATLKHCFELRNEHGNVEVPPFAKLLLRGEADSAGITCTAWVCWHVCDVEVQLSATSSPDHRHMHAWCCSFCLPHMRSPLHAVDTNPLAAGTRHVAMPGAAAACRSLGIDYAPALVGFDVQGGRNLPKILGVVVCEVR
jgi:hypothetical protein